MQGRALVIFLGGIGAVYIMLSVLLGGGNSIGALAQFLSVGSCILAVIRPRLALYLMVIYAGYSDLLKRMMVFDGHVTMTDVLWVRALCPLTLAGIVLGTLVRTLHDGSLYQRRKLISLLVCVFGFIASGLSALRSGGGFNAAATQLADGAAYMFLLFVVPSIFRKPDEIISFIKYCLVLFVPVALYGVKQQIFGLSDFEIEYLRSGLTVLSKHLDDVRPRPFSTLVDSSPFGTSCAICACLALIVRRHHRDAGTRLWGMMSFVLFAIFVAGCVASMTRFANINWALPILLLPVLRNQRGTVALYGTLVALFVTACIYAQALIAGVTKLTLWALENFGGTAIGEQFVRFWTICDRLEGMHDLAHNPLMWTMFGYGSKMAADMHEARMVASHDLVSNLLLEIGWLPLCLVIIGTSVALLSFHRSLWKLRGSRVFNICLWMTGIEFGLLVHNVFAGNVTSTFPVNFFCWFIAGALNSCIAHHENLRVEERPVGRPVPRPVPRQGLALASTGTRSYHG
ncbi:MAG: hypothetical protein ACO1TE_08180 [Prosthecobacter sp.]